MVISHAQHCHLAVTCPFTANTVKTVVIAVYLPYQFTQNQFSGLCFINECWSRHISHTVARFGCVFVCQASYWPRSRWRPRYELSYRGNLRVFLCRTGLFCVEPYIVLSNVFLCRTGVIINDLAAGEGQGRDFLTAVTYGSQSISKFSLQKK